MHMVTLALWALTVGHVAGAAEPANAMPWDLGITDLPPLRARVSVDTQGAYGRFGAIHFMDVDVGLPVVSGRRGGFVLGLGAVLGTTIASGRDGDTVAIVRTIAPSLWLAWLGPLRRSHHATGWRVDIDPQYGTFFRHEGRELGTSGGFFYEGHIATRWIDVGLRADFHGGWETGLGGGGGLALGFKPTAHLALPLSVRVGSVSEPMVRVTTTVALGVHGRPIPGLELGVDLHIPLLGQRPENWFPVAPSVTIKVWDDRGEPGAGAPWEVSKRSRAALHGWAGGHSAPTTRASAAPCYTGRHGGPMRLALVLVLAACEPWEAAVTIDNRTAYDTVVSFSADRWSYSWVAPANAIANIGPEPFEAGQMAYTGASWTARTDDTPNPCDETQGNCVIATGKVSIVEGIPAVVVIED